MNDFVGQVGAAGFAIVPTFLELFELAVLDEALPASVGQSGGLRNLLDLPEIAALATSQKVRSLVDPLLGQDAFPVRGIFFDKTPDANWKVSWHQDLSIAVSQRRDAPGYGPWSEKAGVLHVQPPVDVLERMLVVRIHLDESGPDNGPLRVLPGSHRAGKLRDVESIRARPTSTVRRPSPRRGWAVSQEPIKKEAHAA